MHMTDEEALRHIFHKDIVKAVNKHLKENSAGESKKARKPQVKRKKKG